MILPCNFHSPMVSQPKPTRVANSTYVHIEYDSLGIILVSNEGVAAAAAVAVLQADTENVIRVVKLAEPRQIAHPVDRSDPSVTNDIRRYRVDLRPATVIRTYASQLVKTLNNKLRCSVELKAKY
jgi:hypothetical protein